jgi:hypothetical protein
MEAMEKLLKEIQNLLRRHENLWFSDNFVNNTADVFVKYGFQTTRCFLATKIQRRTNQREARALVEVLGILEKKEYNIAKQRSVGGLYIKALQAIKDWEKKR